MTKTFAVTRQPISFDIVLLVLRVVMGIAFMMHGTFKIQNPLHWMGSQASTPAVFQLLAAVSEFGGGFALIIGLVTRLSALGIFCTMAVAVYFQRFLYGQPFISNSGGMSYELASVFLCTSLLFVINGPGRFSLDRALFGSR
jgi:putative oxidoreductase